MIDANAEVEGGHLVASNRRGRFGKSIFTRIAYRQSELPGGQRKCVKDNYLTTTISPFVERRSFYVLDTFFSLVSEKIGARKITFRCGALQNCHLASLFFSIGRCKLDAVRKLALQKVVHTRSAVPRDLCNIALVCTNYSVFGTL